MTTPHISRDELALYVMGALDGPRADAVGAHASECADCMKLLQAEAAAELALYSAAEQYAEPRPEAANNPGKVQAWLLALARGPQLLALAAAAAGLLVVVMVFGPRTGDPAALPAYTVELVNPLQVSRGGAPAAAQRVALGSVAQLVARPATAPGTGIVAEVLGPDGAPLSHATVQVSDAGSVRVSLPTGPGTPLAAAGPVRVVVRLAPVDGELGLASSLLELPFELELVESPDP